MHKINKFFFSLKCAINGIKTVFKEEQNFKIEFFLGLLAILLGIILHITKIEMIIIILCITIILSAETVNTAIEDLCDKVEPHHDKTIGKIKDIMAGFVLIASMGSIIIGITMFLPKILVL